uniref:Transmembrane protein n=1 Tax=Heterorhabditis bacteriophora TaxID=37862 RepID=A0A1I7XEX8_HETBA
MIDCGSVFRDRKKSCATIATIVKYVSCSIALSVVVYYLDAYLLAKYQVVLSCVTSLECSRSIDLIPMIFVDALDRHEVTGKDGVKKMQQAN